MKRTFLPDRIKLDGVMELLRTSNLQHGWSAEEISISYSPEAWCLPSGLNRLMEEWSRRYPNERSDPKVALRAIHINKNHTLNFQLQATSWREVRPLHESPNFNEDSLVRSKSDGFEMLLPNIGVVHVIASTLDGHIIAFRRSALSHYHPGVWSATYEEGLAPADIGGDAVFQQAALRGLIEEVSAEAHTMPLEAFRVVSVVLEQPLGNPAVVVMVELPIALAELSAERPSDELDATSLISIPIDRTGLRDIIADPSCTLASHSGGWHPTARYRLLMAMAHFFGEEAAADALSRVQHTAYRR